MEQNVLKEKKLFWKSKGNFYIAKPKRGGIYPNKFL